VYGGDQVTPRTGGNEWGIDDEDLFRFVLARTGPEPTFNLIMSTSYHPPYSVDLKEKGFDLEALKANPICAGHSDSELRILGHLWYADKSVSDFVAASERKLDRPLFAITGDHYSRKKFVSVRPMQTTYDQLAVPLILAGLKMLENVSHPSTLAGSHLDILPTLVDLSAPKGFEYHAFGRDLFDFSQPQLGFGCNAAIGPDFVLRIHQPTHVEDLRGQPASDVNGREMALHYRRLSALGWWRVMKGNRWPATKNGKGD
jgi:phosphoglycerol transferase MdoB-like AlkP superfamily enzyme